VPEVRKEYSPPVSVPPIPSGVVTATDIIPELAGLPSITAPVERKDRIAITDANKPFGKDTYAPYARDLFEILSSVVVPDETPGMNDLQGGILLDLGAGSVAYGLKIAEILKARAYIGVEPFYFESLFRSVHAEIAAMESPIPAAVVASDALTLLERLPSRSVSILAAGMMDHILPSQMYREVAAAATRAIAPSGFYIVYASMLLPESDELALIFPDPDIPPSYIGLSIFTRPLEVNEPASSQCKSCKTRYPKNAGLP